MNHIYRIKAISSWVFIAVFLNSYAQQVDTLNFRNHKVFSESMIQGSYDDLKKTFDTYKNDEGVANFYGKAYIKKAKKENDTVQIANGYDLLFKMYFSDYNLALKYVDSIIEVTKHIKHEYYPSRGYLNKGSLLVSINKYRQALELYLEALKHAKENNNIRHQIAIRHNIGRLKWILNNQDEAILIFKENLSFLESNHIKEGYDQAMIATLIGLSESYNKLQEVDSADIYIHRGIQESFKRNYNFFYENFLVASGINNTLRKNYRQALDTLYKAEYKLSETNDIILKSICNTYIAKNLINIDQKEEAVVYLKKVDSVVTYSNYTPDVRNAFVLLKDHYKNTGDKENQLRFLQKLLVLDSLTNKKHKDLNIDIVKKYDTESLIKERDFLDRQLFHQKEEYVKKNIIILIGTSSISVIFFIWYYRKQKLQIKTTIEKQQQIILNTISKTKVKKDVEISHELIIELTDKLEVFEETKRFLFNDVSLISTAKEFKTNSTYLSKVINKSTGKNFANYINDLRIGYAIEQLNSDPKYRLYSITAIAKEVGFNNSKSFSRAFLKKTGDHPSLFIKRLLKSC